MKCRYCGNNLGIEDERCPHCGNINAEAAERVAILKDYKEEFDSAKIAARKKSRHTNRMSRLAIIGIMAIAVIVMYTVAIIHADFDKKLSMGREKNNKYIARNKEDVDNLIKEMEVNRDYLAMYYYTLEYQLRANDDYNDYTRVFTAVIDYEVIYRDILNILDGYNQYGEKTKTDWCKDIAIYIAGWNLYVEGEFWHDSKDSPMHAGEHGAFLADAKKDTQDMVQVYFELTDEQASDMWTMEESEIASMLISRCEDLYSEVTNE